MGSFPISYDYAYILLVVDYVSKWVEAKATKINDAKIVVDFVRSNIFRFGMPKLSKVTTRYGVVHRAVTAYHSQTNGQVKVFNREIKQILQKVAYPNRKDWSQMLEDALWAHRTAYRTSLGMSPYWIDFGKACCLLIEIEHHTYWTVKRCNSAFDQASKERKL
ncbi:pol, partial [Mucuna pruriens]